MKVAESESGCGSQAQRERRGNPVPAVFGHITPRDAVDIAHSIQPKSCTRPELRDRDVDVYIRAPRPVSAAHEATGGEVLQPRCFAGLINNTSGRAAAECDGGRTLQNFYFLRIERIAIVAAEIAHAVNEQIVAGGEAADREVVSL